MQICQKKELMFGEGKEGACENQGSQGQGVWEQIFRKIRGGRGRTAIKSAVRGRRLRQKSRVKQKKNYVKKNRPNCAKGDSKSPVKEPSLGRGASRNRGYVKSNGGLEARKH